MEIAKLHPELLADDNSSHDDFPLNLVMHNNHLQPITNNAAAEAPVVSDAHKQFRHMNIALMPQNNISIKEVRENCIRARQGRPAMFKAVQQETRHSRWFEEETGRPMQEYAAERLRVEENLKMAGHVRQRRQQEQQQQQQQQGHEAQQQEQYQPNTVSAAGETLAGSYAHMRFQHKEIALMPKHNVSIKQVRHTRRRTCQNSRHAAWLKDKLKTRSAGWFEKETKELAEENAAKMDEPIDSFGQYLSSLLMLKPKDDQQKQREQRQ